MKTYYVHVYALKDNKFHIVTAKDESHVKELVTEFWFNEQIIFEDIVEIEEHGVHMTKHESE